MFKIRDTGYVLITVMLLLLLLTVIGLAALGTSSIENMLSGNMRLRERNTSKADAGIEVSTAVINHSVRTQNITGFTAVVNDTSLPTELRTKPFDPTDSTETNPDVIMNVDGQAVNVDIDKMYVKRIGGTAIEFASGSEGAGKSGASNFYSFYRINSEGTGAAGSVAEVGTVFRYVP